MANDDWQIIRFMLGFGGMNLLVLIFLFTLLGSVFSLIGGVWLVLRGKEFTHAQSLGVISFAAGVLLATAFLDILPEASELGNGVQWELVLGGIVALFLFEKSWVWFHHHDVKEALEDQTTTSGLMIGDTIHNFIDGVAIAGSFLS